MNKIFFIISLSLSFVNIILQEKKSVLKKLMYVPCAAIQVATEETTAVAAGAARN